MAHPKLATPRSGYGGRGYRIPGREEVLEPATERRKAKVRQIVYPSVTTVLKQVAKPGIDQWIADQTAAFAVANIPYLMSCREDVGWRYLRFCWSRDPDLVGTEIRTYYEGVKNDAAELGSNLHEIIDAELTNGPFPVPLNEETYQMTDAWEAWLEDHHVTIHHSEFTVVNDAAGFAGTGDADWTITCLHDDPCLGSEGPVRTLVDLKTSRHTWPEHKMQIAALASCNALMVEVPEGTEGARMHEATVNGQKVRTWWVEEDVPSFEKYALLHIRPNDLDTEGNTIPAFCELIEVLDLDIHERKFLGALTLAQGDYELARRERARAA